ncbi:Small subunit (SSU) processome component [Friedmanniomyces endolithicus]|uniref:Small subunit (SSU) processome component n=1 Tax=Friedmanniomyces endolithicus TaxID=329885 RepID=A0AAN6KF43_9PEZI|nr:Small subunit (SSU) processome component [Friedmanniomyces endolithicus]KAK0851013.1 Small subunit (SSU) processome component [Friedmanniomyces endolithicus]KAK0871103.1 Small subunit (SSU) processome component [Friedmanniomyces endolithicus]KAK0883737.1 Small subunit (SSU) processome component [Friedmanniomyces endolithicus]KAK0912160.1 Small subunit (SSU) processome component [Friedmanniomyces endolithicus]
MSTAKRPRRRQQAESKSPSPLPVFKKLKTSTSSHVPTKSGLHFLVDEDARAGRKIDARLTNGVPGTKRTRVDESHALVAPDTTDDQRYEPVKAKAPEVIEISSGQEDSSEYESSEDEQDLGALGEQPPMVNGHVSESEVEGRGKAEDVQPGADDDRMDIVADHEQEGVTEDTQHEQEEPSFGEMLQRRHPGPVDVHASLPDHAAESTALATTSDSRILTTASGTSLSTVLAQALKTNDKDMLESCFNVTDMPSVRSTIERLQSPLAAALLQRLAERIHKSPGRTGYLMVWVQWTIITHGGYLSSQPETMSRLRSLAQVVRERASGLQPLLHLKGKLDLLSAQLEYRERMQTAARAANAEDEEDDSAVLYIEGQQEDDWSDDDEAMEDDAEPRLLELPASKSKGQLATPKSDIDSDDEDDSEDGMPNGIVQEADDGSDGEDVNDGAEEGLFDDEAEETSDDGAEEDDSDDEISSASEVDNDIDSSDAESEPEVKQPHPRTLNRKR